MTRYNTIIKSLSKIVGTDVAKIIAKYESEIDHYFRFNESIQLIKCDLVLAKINYYGNIYGPFFMSRYHLEHLLNIRIQIPINVKWVALIVYHHGEVARLQFIDRGQRVCVEFSDAHPLEYLSIGDLVIHLKPRTSRYLLKTSRTDNHEIISLWHSSLSNWEI